MMEVDLDFDPPPPDLDRPRTLTAFRKVGNHGVPLPLHEVAQPILPAAQAYENFLFWVAAANSEPAPKRFAAARNNPTAPYQIEVFDYSESVAQVPNIKIELTSWQKKECRKRLFNEGLKWIPIPHQETSSAAKEAETIADLARQLVEDVALSLNELRKPEEPVPAWMK